MNTYNILIILALIVLILLLFSNYNPATGNIPSEDLIYMLERMGIYTGIKLKNLLTSDFLAKELL